ncbi:hypothetical protein KUTeg_021538 [Tegillarca granosa]|uniref:Uncharacterized protein n=1 Tax=Tegillarca granosa TaxID=220873 RepID=A0ABQ9E3K9_TEGGR|nr:hypothetical protein KUTeg_021538 [Tegillarca granosa]
MNDKKMKIDMRKNLKFCVFVLLNVHVVCIYRILAAQLTDSGLYKCKASNRLGITIVEANITVVAVFKSLPFLYLNSSIF